ncbi:NAD(P)-binding domain-containing protein [Fulvivirga ulvae]|uniref:NAD(P)-dependent oxidoreductase n=1 Tax=Fulvivirga ulvae TaxID=2904245 RepID=UPI001F415ADB|nr:NAD(P)-dependent oxidoreductase [Fulvivirga ulvae]UII31653.1 NAD(P)-binding domain-containing protein [Fulvivirga ulvae]
MEGWSSMRILITEPEDYSPDALSRLRSIGEVILMDTPNESEVITVINDIDILVIRLGLYIGKDLIEKASRLKYILTATTGLNHIDVAAADVAGIDIVSLKGETDFLDGVPSTAEHTWGLIISLFRNIHTAHQHVVQGDWNRQLLRGHNIKGKKLGIVGLGRVGSQVANYAHVFGCEINAYDPYLTTWPEYVSEKKTLQHIFEECDIISVHVPLEDSTRNLISRDVLKYSKKGACLINTSRGEIWDEVAVAEYLESKHLGGVATDVIKNEQDLMARQSNPLLKLLNSNHKSLLITPHIAGATYESMKMTEDFVVDKLFKKIKVH